MRMESCKRVWCTWETKSFSFEKSLKCPFKSWGIQDEHHQQCQVYFWYAEAVDDSLHNSYRNDSKSFDEQQWRLSFMTRHEWGDC